MTPVAVPHYYWSGRGPTMADRFMRWLVEWALLAEALIGILTFTFVDTGWGLEAAKKLSRWRYHRKGEPHD